MEAAKLALTHKPKLIVTGFSAYSAYWEYWQGFCDIADRVLALI